MELRRSGVESVGQVGPTTALWFKTTMHRDVSTASHARPLLTHLLAPSCLLYWGDHSRTPELVGMWRIRCLNIRLFWNQNYSALAKSNQIVDDRQLLLVLNQSEARVGKMETEGGPGESKVSRSCDSWDRWEKKKTQEVGKEELRGKKRFKVCDELRSRVE